MRVTAKVDYAVRAAMVLARVGLAEGGPVKGERIGQDQDIPVKYLENILSELRQGGLVRSQRGAEGGYWLARPPTDITIADIIRAVEGPLATVRGERAEQLDYGDDTAVAAGHVGGGAGQPPVGARAGDPGRLVAGELPPHVQALVDDPDSWA